jgi:hypothetical protein
MDIQTRPTHHIIIVRTNNITEKGHLRAKKQQQKKTLSGFWLHKPIQYMFLCQPGGGSRTRCSNSVNPGNWFLFINISLCRDTRMFLNSVVRMRIVSPCALAGGGGGLSEMSFLTDFWPLNAILVEFRHKNPRWRIY